MSQTPCAPMSGICSTCIHEGGCLFQKASRYPVWFCDHFHTEAALVAARVELSPRRSPRLKPVAGDPVPQGR